MHRTSLSPLLVWLTRSSSDNSYRKVSLVFLCSAQQILGLQKQTQTLMNKFPFSLPIQYILAGLYINSISYSSLSFIPSLYFEIIMHTLKYFNESTLGKMKLALPENHLCSKKNIGMRRTMIHGKIFCQLRIWTLEILFCSFILY